jgi:hypothetical protein
MFSSRFKQFAAVFILLGVSTALQVSPSSPCSNVCIDDIIDNPTSTLNSNTNGADLSCDDVDYTNTDKGIKFKNCMTCLQTSNYASGSESDQNWFIYNLRYSVDCELRNNNMLVGTLLIAERVFLRVSKQSYTAEWAMYHRSILWSLRYCLGNGRSKSKQWINL